jgi:hypothetical protein
MDGQKDISSPLVRPFDISILRPRSAARWVVNDGSNSHLRAHGPDTGGGRTVRQEETVHSVAELSEKLESRENLLNSTNSKAYLRSLLQLLQVPVSSQTLVFSKSSFQLSQISPEAPRAIYFNDDVYVGWVNHGQFLEIAEVDPQTGPVFYTQTPDYEPEPVIQRQTDECLVCHDTFQARAPVPRVLMLSVLPNKDGNALKAASIITNDASPLRERWGGWYVTGTHGKQRHMGNMIVRAQADDITRYLVHRNAAT